MYSDFKKKSAKRAPLPMPAQGLKSVKTVALINGATGSSKPSDLPSPGTAGLPNESNKLTDRHNGKRPE